jgi:hypothetical protein
MTDYQIGDVVRYFPPYVVEGWWAQMIGVEFVVVEEPESYRDTATMIVATMPFVGLDCYEIPLDQKFQLPVKSFKYAVQPKPTWEV